MSRTIIFRAKLSWDELARIRCKYPKNSDLLDCIVNPQGNYVNVRLDDDTAKLVKNKFGNELYDYLCAKAYQLNGDKYYSYFIQLQEILNLPRSKVNNILEIGPGYNVLNALLGLYDYNVSTMDVNSDHSPTIIGDVLSMPENNDQYDLVCAFQVLQHVPHNQLHRALNNIVKRARHYVYISLPCPTNSILIQFKNKIMHRIVNRLSFDYKYFKALPMRARDKDEASLLKRPDKYNPHYWEVNTKSFPKKRILAIIESCGLEIKKHFHNVYHPYHWFVLGQKR